MQNCSFPLSLLLALSFLPSLYPSYSLIQQCRLSFDLCACLYSRYIVVHQTLLYSLNLHLNCCLCLSQVCDVEWHHYALSLEFPTVSLYVDGVTYDPALMHDNGALTPPKRQARMMIGGCWTGKE